MEILAKPRKEGVFAKKYSMLPAAWAFVIAVIGAVLMRVLHRSRLRMAPVATPRRARGTCKLLLEDRAMSDWKARVWDVASRRRDEDVRICVLLTCRDMADVALCTLEPEMRAFATVRCRSARKAGHSRRTVRRLLRHFVTGDEAWVAVAHPRVRPVDGWDVLLGEALDATDRDRLLSVPVASVAPAFPTIRDGRRGPSKGFARPPDARTTPTVVACLEFLAGSPAQLRERCRDADDGPHATITTALLEADDELERQLLGEDPTTATTTPRYWRCGLTTDASDAEKIDKYGSTTAANLAVKFEA